FHGRVLAARLDAEGVLVVLRGATDGPYPIQGTVDVLVPADQLKLAREILLADAVEDAFGSPDVAGLDDPEDLDDLEGAWPETLEDALMSSEAVGDFGRYGEAGSRSEGLSLRSSSDSPTARERHRARIHGAPAVLVVVVVLMLMAVGVVAASVH
ncbi:MAG TPA: hypothetical protein VKA05_08945, partial [Acidimicrobiales bacterium]|nr:hypothetical protein [Acidimicrobiales bacterium]